MRRIRQYSSAILIGLVVCLGTMQGASSQALADCRSDSKTADESYEKAQELQESGRYLEALESYKQAFATDIYCRPVNARLDLIGMATTYEAIGDYSLALETYRQDLNLAAAIFGPDSADTAVAYNNIGKLQQVMGQYGAARSSLEKALDILIRASGPDQPDTSVAYNNLGALYEAEGEYQKALEYYEKSLAIRLKIFGTDHPATATAFNNLGGIYKELGQYEKSLEFLQKSLPIYLRTYGPDHPATSIAYNNIASVLKALGQYPEALKKYRAALEIDLKTYGPDHPSTAVTFNNIGATYEMMEDFPQALENFEKAIAILLKSFGPDHPATAKAINNIASVYQSMGEYDSALRNYRRALPTAQRSGDAGLKWNVLAGISSTFARLGHPNAAIFFGKQAVNAIQETRLTMVGLDKANRRSYMNDKERVYRKLSALLTDAGRIPEAQRVLDLLKEEEYFEFIRGGDATNASGGIAYSDYEQHWAERFAEISDRVTKRGTELADIRRRAKTGQITQEDRTREKEILSDLEVASRQFEVFLDKISTELESASGGRVAELTEKGLRDLKSLQSTLRFLGPGTVVVYYLVSDSKLIVILTTSETQIAREATVSTPELNRMISDLRKDLLCPTRDPRPASRKLFEKVIAPISSDLEQAGAKTIMLAPDGALRYVPFACLYDGEKFLIERYTPVVFTPASRDKLRVPPSPFWSVAGFGVSEKVSESFTALPSVRFELNSIVRRDGNSGIFPGILKIDREFTLSAIREALMGEYPVMHIASHFVFNVTDTESFLLLGDGSRLSLDQVKHQGFRFDEVDLLTLSACETALSFQDANGREVEGFGVLAQRSGAKGVVASLWSVADSSTGLLMKRMYEERAKNPGLNKAECLRRAQLMMLSGEGEKPETFESEVQTAECARRNSPPFERSFSAPFAHPYYWAPFILMGNFL